MHPLILGYPSLWECICICWGTPVHWDASHILGYPSTWVCIRIYRATPVHGDAFRYIGASTWGCIPIYWGAPVYEGACPYTGVAQYMGTHPRILGYPSTWGCIPVSWGSPVYGDDSQDTWPLEWASGGARHCNVLHLNTAVRCSAEFILSPF